jgi:hypothetical protein
MVNVEWLYKPSMRNEVTEGQMQPGAGVLGLTHRSYERIYYNGFETLRSVDNLVHDVAPWAEMQVQDGTGVRRVVVRLLMRSHQLSEVLERSEVLSRNLEVSIPVGESGESQIVMAMWGINNHDERTNDPIEAMQRDTTYCDDANANLAERTLNLRALGYRFTDSLEEIDTEEIFSLWHPIFDWSRQDIDSLRERVNGQQGIISTDRSVWFSAVQNEDRVVSLAMAERLDLPLGNGESVPIIESTEWCVRNGWYGQGLGVGAVSFVQVQVVRDLRGLSHPPVILAETNFTSRADRIGHQTGMIVGSRVFEGHAVTQILQQNVAVGDGLRPERLRDFTMMYIPPEHLTSFYSQAQCELIIGGRV